MILATIGDAGRRFGSSLALLALLAHTPLAGQEAPEALWQRASVALDVEGETAPGGRVYLVETTHLDAILRAAPLEGEPRRPAGPVVISLPMPDGELALFRIEEAPIMAPALAVRYPSIRNYRVIGLDDPAVHGRLSRNGGSLSAMLITPGGIVQIVAADAHPLYTSVYEKSSPNDFFCGVETAPTATLPQKTAGLRKLAAASIVPKALASGDTLRIYELAVATTAEYYQARGNSDVQVLASINTVISRVNLVYESELAIRFVLIPETDQLFSQDTTDFTNSVPATMREENQTFIDSILDDDDYDIGHVFGTSPGGGNAAGSVVCVSGNKARGASGLNVANDPATEENFSGYRLVTHEIGHQFSAGHTWSGSNGNCTSGQFSQPNAYEPLSGTTIMSYAGTCGADDITPGPADAYFHTHSYDQIINYSVNGDGDSCAQTQNTGNSAPTVDAGPDYTIPADTPFTLTGSAVDPDGDALTYAWEQYDVAPMRISPLVDNGDNPLFRSFPPGTDPSRTFPQLSDILSGTTTLGELLPQADRTMTFRFTARDNLPAGGGVDYDTTTLTVSGGPFEIISPNGGESFNAGCSQPAATWDVGGGSVAANATLALSTDGGLTFPKTLAAGVPNDGSQSIELACEDVSNQARLRVQGDDNIFFDISDGDFTVAANEPEIALDGPELPEGEFDENCEYVLEFSATITDDCSVSAADVAVEFSVFSDAATISNGSFQTNQVNPATVEVSGSALVSDLTAELAIARALITATDGCNLEEMEPYDVTLFDKTPPTIEVSLSPEVLWAPNHKMRAVNANVTVQDNCQASGFELVGVTSDEPDEGTGDGDFPDDIQGVEPGTADTSFEVRAERMGSGDGRTYTATYRVEDGSGNSAQTEATVEVPIGRN